MHWSTCSGATAFSKLKDFIKYNIWGLFVTRNSKKVALLQVIPSFHIYNQSKSIKTLKKKTLNTWWIRILSYFPTLVVKEIERIAATATTGSTIYYNPPPPKYIFGVPARKQQVVGVSRSLSSLRSPDVTLLSADTGTRPSPAHSDTTSL